MGVRKLSELQLELLKVYSFNPTEEDLIEIKKILANYFSNKLISKVQSGIEKRNISNSDLEDWLNEEN